MKKLLVALLLPLSAFAKSGNYSGCYGGEWYNSKSRMSDPKHVIEQVIALNGDGTFLYSKYSESGTVVNIKGRWEHDNKRIDFHQGIGGFSTLFKVVDGKLQFILNGHKFYFMDNSGSCSLN